MIRIGTMDRITTAIRHATMCASVIPATKLTKILKMVPMTVPVSPPKLHVSAPRFAIIVEGEASSRSNQAKGCVTSTRNTCLRIRKSSHSDTNPNAEPLTK